MDIIATKQAMLVGSGAFGVPWLGWSIWAAGQDATTQRRRTALARTMGRAAAALLAAVRMYTAASSGRDRTDRPETHGARSADSAPRAPLAHGGSPPTGPWAAGSTDVIGAASIDGREAPPGAPPAFVVAQEDRGATVDDELARLAARATGYAAQSSGAGTRRSYQSAWRAYATWCASIDRAPLSGDPGLIALYLTKRAGDGLAVASLKVARAAIIAAHRLADVPLDTNDRRLAMVMAGIVRDKAGVSPRQAAAAVPDLLRRLLSALPASNTPAAAAPALAARHRAMLLIGFGAALRRSEIVALSIGDVTGESRGLMIRVRRSKTDQQGKGRRIAIWANHRDPDFCPVGAFEAWMGFRRQAADLAPAGAAPCPAPSDPDARPLFCGVTLGGRLIGTAMSDKIVARLIKQACRHAGLDAAKFSGHSLRRGLLTHAGDLQLSLVDVMRQSRHKSVDTAMSYIEAGDAWRNNITEPVFRRETLP